MSRVSDPEEHCQPWNQSPRAPAPRKLRAPKGTTRLSIGNLPSGVLPVQIADEVPDKVGLAAALLVGDVIEPMLAVRVAPPTHQDAILNAFSNVFGIPAEAAWVVVFLNHVDQAKQLQLQYASWDISLDSARRERLPRSPDIVQLARDVVDQTNRDLAALPGSVRVPQCLTAPIVAVIIARYGFDGGGGPRRAVSRRGLTQLLADPHALADYLASSLGKGGNKADRCLQEAIQTLRKSVEQHASTCLAMPERGHQGEEANDAHALASNEGSGQDHRDDVPDGGRGTLPKKAGPRRRTLIRRGRQSPARAGLRRRPSCAVSDSLWTLRQRRLIAVGPHPARGKRG